MLKKMTPVLYVEAIEPCLDLWVNRLGFAKTVEVPEGDKLGFVILNQGPIEIMYQSRASVLIRNSTTNTINPMTTQNSTPPTLLNISPPQKAAVSPQPSALSMLADNSPDPAVGLQPFAGLARTTDD